MDIVANLWAMQFSMINFSREDQHQAEFGAENQGFCEAFQLQLLSKITGLAKAQKLSSWYCLPLGSMGFDPFKKFIQDSLHQCLSNAIIRW